MIAQKVALITGASTGLGKAAACFLARKGFQLMLNYRHQTPQSEHLLKELRDQSILVAAYHADASQPTTAAKLIQQTLQQYGRIDILVHTVGPFIRERKHFIEYTNTEIEQMVNGNLLSSLWMTHAVLPIMRQQEWGRILFFGFGRVGEAPAWPDRAVYAAAKTALVSFTKTLSMEEAAYGITVNMVCPADIVGERKEKSISEVRNLVDEETPRGRPGSGEDIARVISFLVEDASDFITGNTIQVTGGLDVIRPTSGKIISTRHISDFPHIN